MSDWKIVVDGVVKDFQDDYGYRVEHFPGTGMPPLNNVFTNFALLDGSTYQRTRSENRVFSLIGTLSGSSVSDLHLLRKNLIDVVKPDRVATPEAVELQYTGAGSTTLQGSCFYDAGLEFGQPGVFSELQIGLRFVMPDPYWERVSGASTADLIAQEVITGSRITQRNPDTGTWKFLDGGLGSRAAVPLLDTVNSIISNGSLLFAAGKFDFAGSSASVNASNIAAWDKTQWSSLSPSGLGDEVFDLAFAPDNNTLFSVGKFLTAGSIAASRIAFWSISSSQWDRLTASGANNTVRAVAINNNTGSPIAAGQFTSIGGVAANRLAEWDGSVWQALTSSGMDDTVRDLLVIPGSVVYAVGDFTIAGSVTACRVAKWDGADLSSVGSGMDARVSKIISPVEGQLIAGGEFDVSDGQDTCNVAEYGGVNWKTILSGGVDFGITGMATDSKKTVYLVGEGLISTGSLCDAPDTITTKSFVWNQSSKSLLDLEIGSGNNFTGIFIDSDDTITVAHNVSGSIQASASNLVVNNGTTDAFPIITITGSGRFYEIINSTTGERLHFDLILNSDETFTLDLRPGRKTFTSDWRGDIISSILPGSNLSTWKLSPGNNTITIFALDSSASVIFDVHERFWSLDGGA
jgi:hypothetical protein